jgi:hypothetical protein
MVIATEQGSNMSQPQFSPPPLVFIKIFRLFAVNPCCFYIFDIFFRLLTIAVFKDVEAVRVNSRPWSVKDNKQLLKPREMWAKTILQARL